MSAISSWPAAALMLGLTLCSAPASAAPPIDPDPTVHPATARRRDRADLDARFRVHIDTDWLGYTHFDPDDTDRDGSNTNVVGFGLGRLSLIDTGAGPIVLDRPLLAFGVGAVVLGGRAVVGARLSFVVDGVLRDDADDIAVAGRFVPYFNYAFNPRGAVQPYLGARFGLGGGSVTSESELAGELRRTRVGNIYPIVGVQGGAYVFLHEHVSVDLGLALDYVAPFARVVQLEPPPDVEDDDYDKLGDVVNLALTLGVSAWF